MGKLSTGIPQVPGPPTLNAETLTTRQDLPIWLHRSDIIQSIAQNQVTLITGDTGSGKTTQVLRRFSVICVGFFMDF